MILQMLHIAVVAIAYWAPLRVYRRQDLSLDLVASVQTVAIVVSMVACTADLWDWWIGLMLLTLVLVGTLLTILLYQEGDQEAKIEC